MKKTHPSDPSSGASLLDGAAHLEAHERWTRRTFLRSLGLAGAGSMILSGLPLTAMAASPLAWLLAGAETDRILVLIRLKGGNDGQNMIVPLSDYSAYLSKRPRIAVPVQDILALDPASGMPKSMTPLQKLWQDGAMRVVHSVGYPEQNLSHFRSSDIWGSASDAAIMENSGWMGRWLDGLFPDFLTDPPEIPPAVQIGGFGNLLFLNDTNINLSVQVNDPKQLAEIAKNGVLYDTANLPDCYYGEQLGYLRAVANSTFRYAGVISEAYNRGQNRVSYNAGLGEQLAMVARLIKGRLGTRIYMVTLDGFDTHANQYQAHQDLLNELARAVRAFFDDLGADGLGEKVLAMTISEFGRRLEQNASNGTDHGAAAPMLLFGPGLQGNGFIGTAPSFSQVDQAGNLIFQTDFRQVYATVLEEWLCVPGAETDAVLGKSFQRLSLGFACNATSTRQARRPAEFVFEAYAYDNQIWVNFDLDARQEVRLVLSNMQGQQLQSKSLGVLPPGPHSINLGMPAGLPSGVFIISLLSGNAVGSKKIMGLSR